MRYADVFHLYMKCNCFVSAGMKEPYRLPPRDIPPREPPAFPRVAPALPRPVSLRDEPMPELFLVRGVPEGAGFEPALEELCMLFWLRPPTDVPRLGRSLSMPFCGGVGVALPLPLLVPPRGGVGVALPLPLSMPPRGGVGVALPLLGGGGAAFPLLGAGCGAATPLPPRGAMPPKKCPPAYPPENGRGAEKWK